MENLYIEELQFNIVESVVAKGNIAYYAAMWQKASAFGKGLWIKVAWKCKIYHKSEKACLQPLKMKCI